MRNYNPSIHRLTIIRKICGEANNIPIVEIEGNSAPKSKGKYHYFRWRGRFRSYPGSYQASTRRIEVGKKWIKNLVAPKGCSLKWDGQLVVIRESDGMDYHPTTQDLSSSTFIGNVRRAMALNYKKRQAIKRLEKEQKQKDKIFFNDLNTTCVSLHDSQNAGNCIQGSLAFAEKHLQIARETIIGAKHLFFVNAERLWNIAEKTNNNLAKNAVRKAWERETMVCI